MVHLPQHGSAILARRADVQQRLVLLHAAASGLHSLLSCGVVCLSVVLFSVCWLLLVFWCVWPHMCESVCYCVCMSVCCVYCVVLGVCICVWYCLCVCVCVYTSRTIYIIYGPACVVLFLCIIVSLATEKVCIFKS